MLAAVARLPTCVDEGDREHRRRQSARTATRCPSPVSNAGRGEESSVGRAEERGQRHGRNLPVPVDERVKEVGDECPGGGRADGDGAPAEAR